MTEIPHTPARTAEKWIAIMSFSNPLHGVLTNRWWIPALMVGGLWIIGCDHDRHDDDRARPAGYHEEGVYRDHDGDSEHRIHEEHHDRD